MTRKLFILITIINLVFVGAQNDRFHFKHLSTFEGVSNNSVIAIEQDNIGQIWLGTRNGLNKYNGKEIVTYRNIPNDSLSLSNSDILSILEDKDGFLWVGTYNGLNRYNPKKNIFRNYYRLAGNNKSLVNNVIICSVEMPNGELWFGTANGISIYNKATDNFINVFNESSTEDAQKYKNIQKIFPDSNEDIWVGTSRGLAKLESRINGEFVFKEFKKLLNNNLFIQDIIEVAPGILGLGTKYNGFLYFDIKTETFNPAPFLGIKNYMDIRALQKDDDGNLWLGTTNGVIVVTAIGDIVHLKENRNTNSGISQNYIKSIFKDNNGSIWLGTYSGGANIWNKTNENFVHFNNSKVNNNVVNAIVENHEGTIFFGTEGGDVSRLDKNGTIEKVLTVPNNNTELSYPIQTMLYSKSNLLWVGVLNYGVFVYDLETKKERTDIISEEFKEIVKNTGVFAIKEGDYGDFWFGTFGKGLVKYNIISKKVILIARPEISTNFVKTVLLDENGLIWMGGLGGVNALKLNEAGGYDVIEYFRNRPFLRFNIKTIYKDSHDNIWVGTNSRGLYKFDGADLKAVIVSSKTLISTVNTILEDNKGLLWMSTDKGIIKYNPIERNSIIYEQKGIASNNEFSPNSGLILKNNQFYFGGLRGITTFNSETLITNDFAPKVLLSDLKIKNKSVEINGDDTILTNAISYTNNIVLNYDNANFSISYALPNYINSEDNSYAYRLKGLDDTWIYTDQTEASFTLQNAGDYIFEVKGANDDEVWNNVATTLNIKVNPAPWHTWWAYTAYLILLCCILFAIYWILQSRARLRHKLELEYLESKRNEELNNAKLQFFTNISHEFRTPLTLILGPLQQVLSDYNGTNVIYKKLKIIESSANHLLRLINRLMDFRKLESNQFQLEAAEGNLVKFLKEIFLSFSEYAKGGGYTYDFTTSHKKIQVYYDRYKLERVFYNLISNAFRYTEKGGAISIIVEKADDEVVIKVKDSGVGIAEDYIDKIFDRFFEIPVHNKPEENYNKGTGIGLSIASNIVKLHHGVIQVDNVKPHGAVFSVTLKLGNSHLEKNEISTNFKTSDDVSQYAAQINIPKADTVNNLDDALRDEKEYTLLIVEDNKVLRSFIKEMLKPNYNILQAENGKVGYNMAIKHLPDLIISDVIMPEMVGTELCSKIKMNIKTSHIPVILLTSRTSLVYKFEGLESGADDYISKPFNLKEFKLKIKNLLELKQRLKEKFVSDDHYASVDVSLTSLDEELLNKAFKVVEANMSNEAFDISLFCSELGVSRSMLFTKIKAWTNFTPNEFIQEMRLKRAARLLELDKITIAEVGYMVGFKRPKYFSQCFQKRYGMTPSAYAEKFNDSL